MRKKFTNTFRAFKNRWVTPAHEMLDEKTPEEIYQEASLTLSDNDPGQGLALWGRWGFGNGPLRQWGSNRLDARSDGYGGFFPAWNRTIQTQNGFGGQPSWNNSCQFANQNVMNGGYQGDQIFPNQWGNSVIY